MKGKVYDTVILGSGPAGLTAAIYASRGNLKTLVVSGTQMGGQLMLTTDVEDFPGFPEIVQGPDLIMKMRKQAERLGADFTDGDTTKVDLSSKPFKVATPSSTLASKTLIVATGSSAKWLGLPSEQKLIGRGVSSCAVCDGPFFKGKKVVVVGGGDAAIKEALFLSKFASQVTVIHRRNTLRAFPASQQRAFATKNIKFIWDSGVEEVLGKEKVEGVKVKNIKTDRAASLKVDGVFVAIGHKPNTDFLKGQIDLDEKGYIKIIKKSKVKSQKGKQDKSSSLFSTRTSVEGVFAAGDVHDWQYQQAVTAAAAGCKAAIDVEEYLEEVKVTSKTPSSSSNVPK